MTRHRHYLLRALAVTLGGLGLGSIGHGLAGPSAAVRNCATTRATTSASPLPGIGVPCPFDQREHPPNDVMSVAKFARRREPRHADASPTGHPPPCPALMMPRRIRSVCGLLMRSDLFLFFFIQPFDDKLLQQGLIPFVFLAR